MFVIAIDGPAASGKSSVSRLLARKLGCRYVNSGAFYRAVTWAVLKEGIPLDDEAAISLFLTDLEIQCQVEDGQTVLLLNGADPSLHLRDPAVNDSVSRVSSYPEVRRILTDLLRSLAADDNLVMEGRDIGSVVFPDTPYKFYVDASEEVRATRRAAQGETDSIASRDAFDSSRKTAPLKIPGDAFVVDSSHLTLEGVVGEIIGRLRMKGMDAPF
ncbi:MAG TPA: (d)CMP kinase [Verrucomicrobiales bacterium]|nr:(d)CMP kinase [Verrucomicrobiales bacterium]